MDYGHDHVDGEKEHTYGPSAGTGKYGGPHAPGAVDSGYENPVKSGSDGETKGTKADGQAPMNPGKAESYKNPGMSGSEDADSGDKRGPEGY